MGGGGDRDEGTARTAALRQSGRARRPGCMDLSGQGAGDDRGAERGGPCRGPCKDFVFNSWLLSPTQSRSTHYLQPVGCLLPASILGSGYSIGSCLGGALPRAGSGWWLLAWTLSTEA